MPPLVYRLLIIFVLHRRYWESTCLLFKWLGWQSSVACLEWASGRQYQPKRGRVKGGTLKMCKIVANYVMFYRA